MSLLYIVDGYNAIKRSSTFDHKILKEARNRFLAWLEHERPHGSLRNRLIVVFDGSSEVFGLKEPTSFEVIFTAGESADDKIKKIVADCPDPKEIVVVTDDKDLAFSVRSNGAKIMSTDEFLSKGAHAKKVILRPQNVEPKVSLNIVEREKITEELKKIWLNKKSS
jgi:predicted RNA-binding protein with PIN domain